MSFFPPGYNPRAAVIALFDLCEIDTPDGTFRYLVGTDGTFIDINGNAWVGSVMAQVTSMQIALGGTAPPGQITLSFFQDPDKPDLVAQVKELGADYVKGHEIRFFEQPFHDIAEFSAPTIAPILFATRIMREIAFEASGAQDRSISVSYETAAENRAAATRLHLNTEGHAHILGAPNPSLSEMPTVDFPTQKLYG